MARMRASTLVTLALFGAGAGAIMISAANAPRESGAQVAPGAPADAEPVDPSDNDWLRNTYDSRDECVADYSEAECREESPGGGGVVPGFVYFGPWYRLPTATGLAPPNPGPGKAALAAGLTQPATGVQRFRSSPSTAGAAASRTQRGGFGGSSNYYGSRVS